MRELDAAWHVGGRESWRYLGKSVTNQAAFRGFTRDFWALAVQLGNFKSLCLKMLLTAGGFFVILCETPLFALWPLLVHLVG